MIPFTIPPSVKRDGIYVDLGFIPSMLSLHDKASAKEQLDAGYAHGGGWRPLDGFTLLSNGDMQYKHEEGEEQDPPLRLLAEAQFRDETIRVYEHAWVAIIQKDGSFEVSRMD